jgi:hypothetical protein
VNNGNGTWTLSGSVGIPAGKTSTTITLPTVDDAVFELEESLTVTLGNSVNAGIADGTGVGTIRDDDASRMPTLSINDVAMAEGGSLVFTVTQSVASQANTTASWSVTLPATATTPGEASYDDLDPSRFAANGIIAVNNGNGTWTLSGGVNIPAGKTSASITLPIADDTVFELGKHSPSPWAIP